jgi:RHS repeat-associated protein
MQAMTSIRVPDTSMTPSPACLLCAASPHPSISTGKERDTESGNDYFEARYYSSSMGRFMSPDPFVPFNLKKDEFQAWIGNPQHWNMYAYVLNNPLNHTDPTGLTETIFYRFSNDVTDAQRKFFADHKDAILQAIAARLKETGITDVVFKDVSSLTSQQRQSVTDGVVGASFLVFANQKYGGAAAGDAYGITFTDHQSIVWMGNLLKANPEEDVSTSIFRLQEVGSHELGHNMGFASCLLCHWNPFSNDHMNEGQGMPNRSNPGKWDMTIPQNKQSVGDINKAPVYPHQ